MQHREDQPPAYSRPSLLSIEQQEAAARASAQARQAAQAADSAALKADQDRRSKKGWLAGGAVVLALCAGGAGWMVLDAGKPAELTVAAARPEAASHDAATTDAAALKPAASATPAGSGSDVSAAAILEHGAAPPAAAKGKSLKDMLDAPRTAAEELDQLLASSPPETAPDSASHSASHSGSGSAPFLLKGDAKAPPKPAPREQKAALAKEGVKKAVPLAKAVPVKAVPAKAAPADDASLLAALKAHSKEGGAAKAANTGAAPTSLKQCKQLNAAQAEQCRVRLCAGSAKDDPQCRSLRAAKPEAD
ncbi:hypothetical protein INH39_32140 [Massilia violaceinigra]|uniref:Uncharacterized protein n=1 Tax=Massilia violaceinigra TaxID=2045208 RepID=A0ABY4A8G5_9BURK|nr:hypothetical protein [Massilia violaceinigra]UOD29954.1 hypothetical protein INH39_32140 [Massilia violaceinigra]